MQTVMRRGLVLVFVLCVLFIVGGALAFVSVQKQVSKPLSLEEAQIFTVQRGQTSAKVIQTFIQQGWLTGSPLIYKIWLKVSGQPTDIKAGTYQIDGQLTLPAVLDMMVAGNEYQYSVSLIEGLTFAQWQQTLLQHEAIDYDLNDAVIANLVKQSHAVLETDTIHPEGIFLADTYSFSRQTKASVILHRALDAMLNYVHQQWPKRQVGLPLDSPYQALILASIIEKETAVDEERHLISGVFINRLNKGMRLQTDPTVIYGLGDNFDGNLTRAHLRQPTPYNTYTNHGLPPTPIAMAGKQAINAALAPQLTDALYFVARGDGTHVFSNTLEQHNQAVFEYQIKPNKK